MCTYGVCTRGGGVGDFVYLSFKLSDLTDIYSIRGTLVEIILIIKFRWNLLVL